MHKQPITAAVAAAMLASSLASTADAQPNRGGCYRGESRGDCRERLRVEQQSHQRYVYRNGRYQRQDNTGPAIAGGILGFILGTVVAGNASDRDYYNHHRNDRGWRTRCQQTYPGFDHRNGTYVGQDGYRHYCTR